MGLATSVNRLKDSKAKSKVIILLTDGVNNSGFIDPKIATELAVEYNIKTYTIGLGSNGNARAPIGVLPNGKFQYGITKVEIDEELLKRIANMTGGYYFRATDIKKLEEIYEGRFSLKPKEEDNKIHKTAISLKNDILPSLPIWLENKLSKEFKEKLNNNYKSITF